MPGLGLGLTITRLLTKTLGGEISVDEREGQGLDLPRPPDAVGGHPADAPPRPGAADRQL